MCVSGWEGWGCTDNSEAYSYSFQLLSTLLLCLSNLMFVPPVAIAVRSHYLLEASVYIFTMFFSTVSDSHTRRPPGLHLHSRACLVLHCLQLCVQHRPADCTSGQTRTDFQLCEAGRNVNTKWLQTVDLG